MPARLVHGHSKPETPTYRSWHAMRGRCVNPNHKDYPLWGGAGITCCARWSKFAYFLADMGVRPAGTTLERKDNRLGYAPGNCVWATVTDQNRNRTSFVISADLAAQIVASPLPPREAAAVFGVGNGSISRIRRGYGKGWRK